MRRKFSDLLSELHRYDLVSVDVETTGTHWYRDKLFAVAIAARAGNEIHSAYVDVREEPRLIPAMKREFARLKRVVNHTIKFDAHFCREAGFSIPAEIMECTGTRAAVINEHELSYGLDGLGKKYLNRGKVDIYEDLAKLFGGEPTRAAQMKNLHRAPVSLASKYAEDDPVLALLLWEWQEQEIKKQKLEQVWALEKRLLPVLIDIEQHGVRVDLELTESSQHKIDKMLVKAQKDLDEAAGAKGFNANSPLQMRRLLGVYKDENGAWKTASGYPLEKTDGGEASLGQDVLRALEEAGDVRAGLVLKIRKLGKARSFLKNHILDHAIKDRVYPNYNTTRGENDLGTRTGRFSIDDPALQQIPARDVDIASVVRACFIPDQGYEWTCSDWEQFEFRWFSHYVNEPKLIEMYHADPGVDFHKMVAGITGLPRSARYAGDANAKQINLGLVFGMGQGRLAAEMGLPHTVYERHGREWYEPGKEAIDVFNRYHQAIPGVGALLDKASSLAKARGYVITGGGRHLRFPRGQTHKAGGLVFQGTSADCMKWKMIELHEASKAYDFRMILSVHDETDHCTPKGAKGKKAREVIKQISENFGDGQPIQCRVPIRANVAVGPNWWEASK